MELRELQVASYFTGHYSLFCLVCSGALGPFFCVRGLAWEHKRNFTWGERGFEGAKKCDVAICFDFRLIHLPSLLSQRPGWPEMPRASIQPYRLVLSEEVILKYHGTGPWSTFSM